MECLEELFDISGVGGVLVAGIVTALVTTYSLTIVWIAKGHVDEKTEKPPEG
ncbi:MAG: hypothetical protein ACYTFG_13605 [Planctomycetota bacterium]|jgi:hypothetical protein